MSHPLRILFAGTPDFASQHLQAIVAHHNIVAVYTQPDRPAGRGRKLRPSPVKTLANEYGIPVYQPKTLKNETAQTELAALKPDLMIVVAYGLILPQTVLDIPTHGCINVHGSLLPAWRGAAPIQRSLMAEDRETGVTIMQMDAGLDTGDMLHKVTMPIVDTDTSATLYEKLALAGESALKTVIGQITSGTSTPEKQDDALASYAHKITKEEGRIDWSQPAERVSCHVRGLNPWPVAWTTINDEIIRCWGVTSADVTHNEQPGTILQADKSGLQVACGQGIVTLTRIQLPGKRAMAIQDVWNSRKTLFAAGSLFQ